MAKVSLWPRLQDLFIHAHIGNETGRVSESYTDRQIEIKSFIETAEKISDTRNIPIYLPTELSEPQTTLSIY